LSIGLALALIVAIVVVVYARFGERLHNWDVDSTKADVTQNGVRVDTPQRDAR
jgi:hypothetical protein